MDTPEEVLQIQAYFCQLNPGERNDTDTSGEYVWTHWSRPDTASYGKSSAAMEEVADAIKAYTESRNERMDS